MGVDKLLPLHRLRRSLDRRAGFIITTMARPSENVVSFCYKRCTCEQRIKGGEGRAQMDSAFLPFLLRHHGSPSASCAGLQPRQLPAHAGDVGADWWSVNDVAAGEADQDRRQARQPPPPRRDLTPSVRRDPAADRGTAAAATSSAGVRVRLSCRPAKTTGEMRLGEAGIGASAIRRADFTASGTSGQD
eukprot:gene50555-67694_t